MPLSIFGRPPSTRSGDERNNDGMTGRLVSCECAKSSIQDEMPEMTIPHLIGRDFVSTKSPRH